MKILIVRSDHLGDLLLCTPLFRSYASAGHTVDVIASESAKPILDGNPVVHRAIAMESICPAFPSDWRRLSRWITGESYDVLVLPNGRPKELLWASFFSGVPRRFAMWSGLWGRLTLHTCLRSRWVRRPRHFADIMLDLARVLGCCTDDLLPEVYLTDEEKAWATEQIENRFGGKLLVGVHPGHAGNTCNLPALEYGRLANLFLSHDDVAVVITGTEDEKQLLERWPTEVLGSSRVWNAVGRMSLRQLAAVIANLDLYVVPSTGPLHLASSFAITTLSPFCPISPKSPSVWGNLGGRGVTVGPDIDTCRGRRSASTTVCDFRGMVDAEMLYQKALPLLYPKGTTMAPSSNNRKAR